MVIEIYPFFSLGRAKICCLEEGRKMNLQRWGDARPVTDQPHRLRFTRSHPQNFPGNVHPSMVDFHMKNEKSGLFYGTEDGKFEDNWLRSTIDE